MKANGWLLVLLCGFALAAPVPAQEEPQPKTEPPAPEAPKSETPPPKPAKERKAYQEPALKRWGGLEVSVGAWYPDLASADYNAAAVYQSGRQGIVSQVLELPSDSVLRATVQARWLLPRDWGALEIAYDAVHQSSFEQRLTPGIFQYGELVVLPEFAGVADDAFADGFRAKSLTKSRRFRLEYAETAFQTARTRGSWHAGLHSIDFSRHLEARYYALVPSFPPLIPPIDPSVAPVVDPRPDAGIVDSTFSGIGPAAGLDVTFALHPRASVIGGFSVGIVDGNMDTKYSSLTHAYSLDGVLIDYAALLVALDDPVASKHLAQFDWKANVSDINASHVAEDFEAYLGVEGRVWHGLRLYAKFRALVLVNAASDVRPTSIRYNTTDFTVFATGVAQEPRNAGYVGFEAGLSYRF